MSANILFSILIHLIVLSRQKLVEYCQKGKGLFAPIPNYDYVVNESITQLTLTNLISIKHRKMCGAINSLSEMILIDKSAHEF